MKFIRARNPELVVSKAFSLNGLNGECACPPSFVLYLFPTERQCPETRKEWIKAVNC